MTNHRTPEERTDAINKILTEKAAARSEYLKYWMDVLSSNADVRVVLPRQSRSSELRAYSNQLLMLDEAIRWLQSRSAAQN
jgi:hypothetical protein